MHLDTPNTPLSNLLIQYAKDRTPSNYEKLCQTFTTAIVGVCAEGTPEGQAGMFQSTSENPFRVASTSYGDGQSRVLAFADPEAFAKKFGPKFNALMRGIDVCNVVKHSPGCAGILLNNANEETSFVFSRKDALRLMGINTNEKPVNPWWKFW